MTFLHHLHLWSILGLLVLTNAGAEEAKTDLGAIWFIGDSITQSNADGAADSSPRKELFDLLTEGGFEFTFTGHHARNTDGLPKTGDTPTDNLYHYHSGISGVRIGDDHSPGVFPRLPKMWNEGRLAKVKPDRILIMLGTNDIGTPYEIEDAPARLRALIDSIYQSPDAGDPTIFLATIPPNRRKESDRTNVIVFNESIPQIVEELREAGRSAYFVDQFSALNPAFSESMRPDKLHVNQHGNQLMAQEWFSAIVASLTPPSPSEPITGAPAFPGEKTDFQGFDQYSFRLGNVPVRVICPEEPSAGKPWLWRSLFWDAIKPFRDADLQLVAEGYHVVLVHGDVSGHPSGNANLDAAYDFLTEEHGFSSTCSMAAMSRGNLSLFRWASTNPEKVESIYVDNGVSNIFSWPAGYNVPGNKSTSDGDLGSWEAFKRAFGFATDEEALASRESPIDQLVPLAEAKVPILMVCGSRDKAVPHAENDAIMQERYEALGGEVTVIIEDKGHSHGMKDPTPVLEFIRRHTR